MMRVNLLPIARRNAVARLGRVRRWTLAIGTGTAITATALSGGRAMWTDDRAELRADLSQRETTHTELIAHVSSLKEELSQKRESLHAANEIGDEPDWSILLALIADRTEEHVVLTRVSLDPAQRPQAQSNTKSKDENSPESATLMLLGIGTSAHQVSLFSVRLEEMAIFERVVIESSARAQTGQLGSITFTIRCRLRGAEG